MVFHCRIFIGLKAKIFGDHIWTVEVKVASNENLLRKAWLLQLGSPQGSPWTMVRILDGHSEIGAHELSEIGNWICLWYLFRSKTVTI